MKETVYNLLQDSQITDIVATNIYSKMLRQDTGFPAISYQRIIDNTGNHLKGLDKERALIQINLYSKSEKELEQLLYVLKNVLEHKAVFQGAVDGYEEDTKLHTIKIDYQFII